MVKFHATLVITLLVGGDVAAPGDTPVVGGTLRAAGFNISGASYTPINGLYTKTGQVCEEHPVYIHSSGNVLYRTQPGMFWYVGSKARGTDCKAIGILHSSNGCTASPAGGGCAGK